MLRSLKFIVKAVLFGFSIDGFYAFCSLVSLPLLVHSLLHIDSLLFNYLLLHNKPLQTLSSETTIVNPHHVSPSWELTGVS